MSLPFLLEIGTEEIPDWMIPGALESLKRQLEGMGIAARMDATPRRLTARAENLPERLPDTEERVTGPRKTAPEKAVEGFARKQGVTPAELCIEGEYYTYLRKTAGRQMIDVLAESLPGIILKITFPKTMYWTGKTGPRFIRPIRWIVALLGADVIPFELAGVHSSDLTFGHRRLTRDLPSRDRKGAVPVTIETYEQTLRDNFVILSAAERRQKIEDEIAALGIRLKSDPALLETLVYLTEYPTPIVGEFDPQFLALPEEVLITVMRHHQKYFSVEDEAGRLAPRFVAVMNTNADPEGLVRRGNERVLRARFNDARFFWQTDQRKTLADRVEDLAHVTFQAKLGSYLEKTNRVVTLVKELGGDEHAQRAARLAKCRSHYRTGEGVYRIAGCRRRTLRARAGRAGRSLAGHLRSLQTGEHGRFDPAPHGRATGLPRRQAGHVARMFSDRHGAHRLARSVRFAARGAGRGQDHRRRRYVRASRRFDRRRSATD